jgi:aerobic carbon-monoxide dehydrogenase medium subunit
MKPAPFQYHAPTTLDEALELLANHGDDAAPLAGGQSLLPMMNMREATPGHIVDLNKLPGLDRVSDDGHTLTVGALVRHRVFERPARDDPTGRLLAATAPYVGSAPIRTRGTLVGALATANPAAEWCVVAQLLDGEVVLRTHDGARTMTVDDFFAGPFRTRRNPDEMVVGARLKKLPQDHRTAFVEESRTRGDFPLVCAAVSLSVLEGRIDDCRVAVGGVGPKAFRARTTETALTDVAVGDAAGIRAAARSVSEGADHGGASQPSSDYKRHLGAVVIERALLQAIKEEA